VSSAGEQGRSERPEPTRGVAADAGIAAIRGTRWLAALLRGHVVEAVGGPARARVITVLACVLALNSADTSTIGAVAPQLHHSLHIDNAQIGLLSSVTLLIGAAFVIPFGLLVDRAKRVPMLGVSVMLWSAASLLSAIAGSYETLLLTRLLMGAVTATAGPAIASLTGDYFPSRERGRIYAYIIAGEVAGTAVGFTVSGLAASILSWRAAFVLIALPGFALARAMLRLPEPLRGGQSRIAPGAVDLHAAVAGGGDPDFSWQDDGEVRHEEIAHRAVRARGVEPDERLILRTDPDRMGVGAAARYVLSIPSNRLLIVSSALGYFFFAGLGTFLVTFVQGQYHVGQAETTLVLLLLVIASVIGTLVSGRLTDSMVRRGAVEARVWVPAVCYMGATVAFVPGVLGHSLTPALWFDIAGAALLAAANPPLDAARLDIMPAALWGRAESTRTVARSLAQALAPVIFGALADLIAGIAPEQAPIGTRLAHPHPTHNSAMGLELTFLIMLATLGAAGWFMLRARHTYAGDIAVAAASQERIAARGRA
jgi:MFS family permease